MLTREAFRPPAPPTTNFLHIGTVDHRNKGVPSTWRPFSQETIAATLPTQYDNCILFKPRIQNPRTKQSLSTATA